MNGEGGNRVVCIIQARMGSTRLPGKVLLPLAGKPVLLHVVDRVAMAGRIDRVVVATTTREEDGAIVELLGRERPGIGIYRGSEEDVLDRYYRAAGEAGAEAVVRVTSDCPLIDPEVIDETVALLQREGLDYASNVLRRTYPRGLDVEAFTADCLRRLWESRGSKSEREHVTTRVRERPQEFRMGSLEGEEDRSEHRWTLDEQADYRLLERIFDELGAEARTAAVMELLERHPDWKRINQDVKQKRDVDDGVERC